MKKSIASKRLSRASVKRGQKADIVADCTFPTLRTRMSPSAVSEFINSGLSDQQISAIREMGFGGILCLKTDVIPGHLAYWLIANFDPFTCSLPNIQLPIREDDIHLATGIPMGDIEIKQASRYDQSEEFLSLVRAWKSQFGRDRVTYSHILSTMAGQREGGDEFKRNFIVFLVSAFLMGVKGEVPSLRILKCLSDVSLIPQLNWCEFTRNNMISSVMQWRVEQDKEAKGSCKKTFKGPVMVLIFIYLDRVVFKSRSVARVFPTLCAWNKDEITSRVSKEKREARRFGAGFVDVKMVKKAGCCCVEGDVVNSQQSNQSQQMDGHEVSDHKTVVSAEKVEHGKQTAKRSRVSSCIDNMACAGKALAHAFEIFTDTVNSARIEMPGSTAVSQLADMAESLTGGVHLTPPIRNMGDDTDKMSREKVAADVSLGGTINDPTVVASVVVDGAIDAAGTECKSGREVPGAETATYTGSSDEEDPCWKDASFVEAVFALTNAFSKDPGYEPSTKKRRVSLDCPTFNLFVTQHTPEPAAPLNNANSPVTSPPPDPISVFPMCDDTTIEEVKDHCRRDIVVSEVFRSPFIQRNIPIFSELSQAEKDAADLVFGDGFDNSEVLVRNRHFQLRRCDLQTFVKDVKIDANVINAWAHLLNTKEVIRSPSSPLRLYAFVTRAGIKCEDSTDFEKLSLMFFPFALREPVLICVNFISRKIEVIHPYQPQSLDFDVYVKKVRTFIMTVMTATSKRFEAVQFFSCEEFMPRSKVIERDDGIFLMCYMEIYAGSRRPFKTHHINSRPVDKVLFKMKLKYSYALLSCDDNELKSVVLANAKYLSTHLGNQDANKLASYSDADLLKYAFSVSKGEEAKFDEVVQTRFGNVTRDGIATLKPRKWIMDMVIDMVGIYATLHSAELLYIPTTASFLDPKKDKRLGRNYINTSYMPKDGNAVIAIFIPLIQNKHWFLCVCDLEKKKTFILNSLPSSSPDDDLEFAADVLSNVVDILVRSEGYKCFQSVPLNEVEVVPVPRQTNGFDCGVFVLKWLEAGRDSSLWTDKKYYKDMGAYRKKVALRLLRWEENKREVF